MRHWRILVALAMGERLAHAHAFVAPARTCYEFSRAGIRSARTTPSRPVSRSVIRLTSSSDAHRALRPRVVRSSCLLLRGVGVGDSHRFSCNRSCGGGVGAVPCTSDQPVS